jgi:hypothetical protein
MTKFEDQLFDDLMREHGSTLADTRPHAAPIRRVATRRTLLAAGAGCAAAGAIAGTLVASGGTPRTALGTPAAYAVTKNPDGTVTLAVYKTSGFAGANARLRQLGSDQVVIVPVGPGCPSMDSLPAPVVPVSGHISTRTSASRYGGSITVSAQGIPAGDILVVAVETTTNGPVTTSLGSARLTSPPAPSCVSLPAAPPPPSSGGSSGAGVRVSGHS